MKRIAAGLMLLWVCGAWRVCAQEMDCSVEVNYEAVATTHSDQLSGFARDVADYINGYRWGAEGLDGKVKCTLSIFIQSALGENRYTAQAFIGSQRPVFGLEKSTAVVRLFDEAWEFTYLGSRPISHDSYVFDDLASFLDFYVFVILGYDFDTYEISGGTPFFQKAADIANLGRSTGAKGWTPKSGSYSRIQLIDEILSPKSLPVRRAYYGYHFTGLDSLAADPERARASILRTLETLGRTRANLDPRNLYLRTFFESKYQEIAEVFSAHPDPGIFRRLSRIDPAHQSTYEAARERR
ncbi:MAG: DUF4835 family protein [Bacteroidota bacterium]